MRLATGMLKASGTRHRRKNSARKTGRSTFYLIAPVGLGFLQFRNVSGQLQAPSAERSGVGTRYSMATMQSTWRQDVPTTKARVSSDPEAPG
jgi:hypothetical protein